LEKSRVGVAWSNEEDVWVVSMERESRDRVSDAGMGEESEEFGVAIRAVCINVGGCGL
jgi:hypothetical protein